MSRLELARKLAARSTHRKHRLGAVVVRGGAVLSLAANGSRRGQCAERRALRRGRFDRAVIYVARSNGLCSKPCAACLAVIRAAGIKAIVYFDQHGAVHEDAI